MTSWAIDHDPSTWLEVPYLENEAADEAWAARACEEVQTGFAPQFTLDRDFAVRLRAQLAILCDLRRFRDPSEVLLAHLPGPEWDPFPVMIAFRSPVADSPDYLLELAGANGLPAVQPPSVEHVMTAELGQGVRVLRHADGGDLGIVANLCYAWRSHETDIFVFAQTADLALLEEIGPDLTALTATIRAVENR